MTDEKSAYEQKYQAKLDEWRAEIDKFAAKARQKEADARLKYEDQVETLRARQAEAGRKLQAIRESGNEAWGELKQGADDAWKEMERAFEKAMTRFR